MLAGLLVGGIDSGEYGANTGSDAYGGGYGLYATSSLVSMFASEARAGDGHFSVYWDGGEGGDGARMAPAVREAFTDIYRSRTGDDSDAAQRWLTGLVESDRYVEDVWAG